MRDLHALKSLALTHPRVRHWHRREARFVGLVALTALVIALQLSEGLQMASREGTGWRTVNTAAIQRGIDAGDLRDREADWYHPATPVERKQVVEGP
jgi:hypothetical protein